MCLNMHTEKLTLPLNNEDGRTYLSSPHNLKKFRGLSGITLLVIINISLVVVNTLTLSQIKKLENEVDFLKYTITDMKLRTVRTSISATENHNLYGEDLDEKTQAPHKHTEVFIGSPDSASNSVEYDYYDSYVLNNIQELNEGSNQVNGDIQEVKRNLTNQGTSLKVKRNVVSTTQDGVVVNSESYAERKAKNNTAGKQHRLDKYKVTPVVVIPIPSSFGSASRDSSGKFSPKNTTSVYRSNLQNSDTSQRPASPIYTRRSRVMHHEDKSKTLRRLVKKPSLKSGDTESEETTSELDFTIIRDNNPERRRHGHRNLSLENLDENKPRMGRARLPAVHYNGDTSRYVVGQHTNFNGNGHLRHPQRTFVDWKISDWATSTGMGVYFSMDEGVLTVKQAGIYFIYAQIYYLDEHDTTGFRVHKNSEETVLQCTITIHARERRLIGNTCYTAGVEYLSEGDTISLADVTNGRYSLFEPGKSFFGLIKLSDMKINRFN